jgi:serine/threonine-protein kinase
MDDRITAERWARLEGLLDAALTLPPGERASFLARQTGGDEHLLRDVQRLLDQAQTRDDLLDRPAATLVQGTVPTGLAPGTVIGAYRVLEPIGRGGMGEVYRAERADGQFDQQVALKLIRREAVDQIERFHDERRLLAQLDHPGIARLFDGGVADDGRPYMVMEWVEGQPITIWCRDHQTDLRQRLDVFQQVCEAVAYAHRNLLVHRDLKPGNVLVNAEGRAKLLDFGVAKLLTVADLAQQTQAPVTPAYAAPEQLSHAPVTTAADVYALGLLLFELLTGERPFHRPQMSLPVLIERQLREAAPAPSAVAAKQSASPIPARQLRGDLDAIVAKTLRKEPEHRYETVAALQADLQRHLHEEPVAARRGARGYVLGRFLLRYRWAVAGVTALILTLAAGLTGTYWQANRAQRETTRARVEAARASATKDFLINVFRASDPRIAQDKPRGQITARELLDRSAPSISERFTDEPDLQIELLGVVADIYSSLNETERYRPLRERRDALVRQRYGELHPALIEGVLTDSQAAGNRGDKTTAAELVEQADDLIHRAGLDRSELRARWWLHRAETLESDSSRRTERAEALGKAAELYAAVAPADPGYVEALFMLGNSRVNREPAEAERYLAQAAAVAEHVRQRDDGQLAFIYGGLAMARQYQGDFAGAEPAFERAVELTRKTYGDGFGTTWTTIANYGAMLHRSGKRERALAVFEQLLRAIPAQATDLNEDHDAKYAREMYASCLAAEGRGRAAVALLEPIQQAYLRHTTFDFELRRMRRYLGDAYDRAGRPAEARAMLKAALDERIAKDPPDYAPLLAARERYGRLLLSQDDTADAAEQFREVLARAGQRRLEAAALAHAGLARIALNEADLPAALDASRIAVAAFESVEGLHDVRTGPQIWLVRSRILLRCGDPKGAHEWAQRALEASRRYDHPSAPSIAEAEAAARKASTP